MMKFVKNDNYVVGGQYSQGIIAGDFLFTCGNVAYNPETGKLVNSSIEAETRQVLNNIETLANIAGTKLSKTVKINTYLTDMNLFDGYNKIYIEFFPDKDSSPARTTVQVGPLLRDVHVEIDAIIYIPSKK